MRAETKAFASYFAIVLPAICLFFYQITPASTTPNETTKPLFTNNDAITLRTLVETERPLIILKRARAGSTWIAEQISILTNRTFTRELQKGFRGDCEPSAIEYILLKLHEGGFTINPLNDGFLRNRKRLFSKSCWERLVASLRAEKFNVLVWTRQNAVGQSISNFRMHTPKDVKIHVSDTALVEHVRKEQKLNEQLGELAQQLNSEYFAATYEEFLDYSKGGHPKLLEPPFDSPIRRCWKSDCSSPRLAVGADNGTPYLEGKVENFQQVRDYLSNKHQDLLPWLLAP